MRIACDCFTKGPKVHLHYSFFYKPLKFLTKTIATMKKQLLTVWILLSTFSLQSFALQLSNEKDQLNPTIENAPSKPLCPHDTVVLSTQEYDSYQWYSRTHWGTKQPISGANQQELTYYQEPDSFHYLSVKVTHNGQEAFSPEVLIDLYLFRPQLYATGENVNEDMFGNIHACKDNFRLTLFFGDSLGFSEYQWIRSGEPIEGANDGYYEVEVPGFYEILATPNQCPNLTVYSDNAFNVSIYDPTPPVITQEGDSLLANWNIGQWFYEEEVIPGATHWVLIPEKEGYYTFEYIRNGCPAMSKPYLFSFPTNIDNDLLKIHEIILSPIPARDRMEVRSDLEIEYFEIYDIFGRKVKSKPLNTNSIDVTGLSNGNYYIYLHTTLGGVVKKFIKSY